MFGTGRHCNLIIHVFSLIQIQFTVEFDGHYFISFYSWYFSPIIRCDKKSLNYFAKTIWCWIHKALAHCIWFKSVSISFTIQWIHAYQNQTNVNFWCEICFKGIYWFDMLRLSTKQRTNEYDKSHRLYIDWTHFDFNHLFKKIINIKYRNINIL